MLDSDAMRRVLYALLGAVAGYALVALTLGWVLDGPILALAYVVAVVAGLSLAILVTRASASASMPR